MGRSLRHPIVLTEEERARLQLLAEGGPHADRAAALLACADGQTDTAVAAHLSRSPQTIAAWRARFTEHRLDSLTDRPRGRPARRNVDAAANTVLVALTRPGPDGGTWTIKAMAAEVGLSERAVAATWAAARITPHRKDLSRPGVDPLWHGAARTPAGLYLAPDVRLLACWVADTPPRRVDTARPLTGWEHAREQTVDLLAAADTRLAAARRSLTAASTDAGLTARLGRVLAELAAARPAGAVLHLVVDRPADALPAPVRRLLDPAPPSNSVPTTPAATVSAVPTPTAWTALVRAALTVTTWEHHLRHTTGRPLDGHDLDELLRQWRNDLLAAAHHPHPTATHALIRPADQAHAALELMRVPRPRTRRRTAPTVPTPDHAWAQLTRRWGNHPRHHWPDRPHLALTHLRRHADELALEGEDAVAALVLHTDHRRHLDLVEHLLHQACIKRLVRRRDAATALGIGVERLDQRRAALHRVTASATATLHLPRRRTGPLAATAGDASMESTGEDLDTSPPLPAATASPTGARQPDSHQWIAGTHPAAIAAWLVEHWQKRYEDLDHPDHQLPDPGDHLAVAEHALDHPYPTPRDIREIELLAALRLVEHVRSQLRAEHTFWLGLARRHGVPHTLLGAATARSAGASRVDHHLRTRAATTAMPAPALDDTATQSEPAPWWQPYTDRIRTTLRDLLTPQHRRLIRRDHDLRDTLDELDHALKQAAAQDGPDTLSTTAVGWLLVLIFDLTISDLTTPRDTEPDPDAETRATLTAALAPALVLRRELHAARDGTPSDGTTGRQR